jgi:hypothetical protein
MNKLNNLFQDDAVYVSVVDYKRTGKVPAQARIKKRFRENYDVFTLQGTTLFYEDRQVVKKKDVDNVLKEVFESNDGVGKGVTNFYKFVSSKYINISRDDVKKYLQQQPEYQITRQLQHRTNKPIVSSGPNKVWAVDLIDVSWYTNITNQFNRYIFTCVDVFSRKVWLEKLKKKDSESTMKVLDKIVKRAGIKPDTIMSDNGTEFKGYFKQYCEDSGIKQNLSRTYAPQSNSVVERANLEVRKLMRALMARNDNHSWVNELRTIEEVKNRTYNMNLKSSPNEVWAQNKEVVDLRENPDPDDKQVVAAKTARERVVDAVNKWQHSDDYKKGEPVRVKMSSVFSGVRKLVKSKLTKQLVVTYTPEIFKVHHVVVPRKRMLARRRYYLENNKGEIITTANGNRKPFYASELMRAGDDDTEPMSMERALHLNKVQTTPNDLNY